MNFIYRYGLFYVMSLFIFMLLLNEIKLNNVDFYLFLFCFCLNMYFAFHRGVVFAIGKQNDFLEFQEKIIEKTAEKMVDKIKEEEEENNKMN